MIIELFWVNSWNITKNALHTGRAVGGWIQIWGNVSECLLYVLLFQTFVLVNFILMTALYVIYSMPWGWSHSVRSIRCWVWINCQHQNLIRIVVQTASDAGQTALEKAPKEKVRELYTLITCYLLSGWWCRSKCMLTYFLPLKHRPLSW